MVFAHRGMSTLAPENTLSAIRLCKEHSVRWFEFDLATSKDGIFIACHDETLDRCTNSVGLVSGTDYPVLSKLEAGSWFSDAYKDERIPTLSSIVDSMNELDLCANVEIKVGSGDRIDDENFFTNLKAELSRLRSPDQALISSFNHLLLREFKKRNPQYKVACLFTTEGLWEDWKPILEVCQADYIHPEDKGSGLTKSQIKAFKEAGVGVNVWTVNQRDRANQLFNWGVDGVITDVPQEFSSTLKEKFDRRAV